MNHDTPRSGAITTDSRVFQGPRKSISSAAPYSLLIVSASAWSWLSENLIAPLQQQRAQARALHRQDLADGFGAVWLPDVLAGKYPPMPRTWGWQWVGNRALQKLYVPKPVSRANWVKPLARGI